MNKKEQPPECLADEEPFLGARSQDLGRLSSARQGLAFSFGESLKCVFLCENLQLLTDMIRNQNQYTPGSVEWDFSDGEGSTTPPSPPNCSDTTQVIMVVMMITMMVMLMLK